MTDDDLLKKLEVLAYELRRLADGVERIVVIAEEEKIAREEEDGNDSS